VAAFPSYAKLTRAGYAHSPRPGVIRTNMEAGPPKQATIESRILHRINVAYLIDSKADYQSFLAWWQTTISRVDWFDWTDPLSGAVKQARIVGGEFEARPTRPDLEAWVITFDLEYWGS